MKKLPKLDTTFCCPFCKHPDSVGYRKEKIGEGVCEVGYAINIHFIVNGEAANAPQP
ncbi:hypothetical protein AMTRI_Chr03g139940 [Amborella trichopoda]